MMTRRHFLEFLGRTSLATAGASLVGCSTFTHKKNSYPSLRAESLDALKTVPGLSWDLIIKARDPISATEFFGDDNDYLAYIPFNASNPLEGYLWSNHETFRPQFLEGWSPEIKTGKKSAERIHQERLQVGGSLLHIKKENQKWQVVKDSKINKRFTAETQIPFAGGVKVKSSANAMGTMGNCCGGLTPWKTFLTCEENYHHFYGESVYDKTTMRYKHEPAKGVYSWEMDPRPPEHYGWVNEIDPVKGTIKKHTSLGRFAHEGATVVRAADGRAVVYMGDDANDEHFYKFVSDSPTSLENGTLYVAHLERGFWIPLDVKKNPELKLRFKTQTELLIRTREAAKMVGATKLDRPEDCEVDPLTGDIYLACTNNVNNPHGQILKFKEKNRDFASTEFTSEVYLKGGSKNGFSCPDNLAFDSNGNLWMVTDLPDSDPEYKEFGNNSLFFIPTHGEGAGEIFRLAIGPMNCEFTGLFFAPDQETLFMSVQHPGSASPAGDPKKYTSHWPEGGLSVPRSSVVALSGPTLKQLLTMKV